MKESVAALDDSNKLRCMTWSEQESSGALTDAYTECVRDQAVRQGFPVRYTSYELLCCYPEPSQILPGFPLYGQKFHNILFKACPIEQAVLYLKKK